MIAFALSPNSAMIPNKALYTRFKYKGPRKLMFYCFNNKNAKLFRQLSDAQVSRSDPI